MKAHASGTARKTKALSRAIGKPRACNSVQAGILATRLLTSLLSEPFRRLVPEGDENYLSGIHVKQSVKAPIIMAEDAKKTKTSVPEFFNQVRSETKKVVWPTREETIRTAIFVFIMMVMLSLFFLGVDSMFNAVVKFLLTLA